MSWNLEPSRESYGKNTVRGSIEKALKNSSSDMTLQELAERFGLAPGRYDKKFIHLSGERWRAAAALGFAQNKKIYFSPYYPSDFYYSMCCSGLLKCLRELTDNGALIALPTGSDSFIKHIADEIVYLDKEHDTDALREHYSKHWNGERIK